MSNFLFQIFLQVITLRSLDTFPNKNQRPSQHHDHHHDYLVHKNHCKMKKNH